MLTKIKAVKTDKYAYADLSKPQLLLVKGNEYSVADIGEVMVNRILELGGAVPCEKLLPITDLDSTDLPDPIDEDEAEEFEIEDDDSTEEEDESTEEENSEEATPETETTKPKKKAKSTRRRGN